MMKLLTITVAYLLVILSSFASSIIPLSIEKQLESASGVVHGVFLGSTTVRDDKSGDIYTNASFRLIASVGLKYRDILSNNRFQIYYRGGTWQGIKYSVSGSPRFTIGEEVVLLVTKTNRGFVLTNSALGKYFFKRKGSYKYLSSSYFSRDNDLGEIPLTVFESDLYKIFGERFQTHEYSQVVSNGSLKQEKIKMAKVRDKRVPASTSELLISTEDQTVIWPVVIFGLLGLFSVLFAWRKHN